MNELPADQSFELPDWMHPHHGAIDWGLVLVLALSLLAALPFLANPGLPRQTDAELHVFRTAELTGAIREGVIYPRWAPNFWYGYGYPFFNYYASLTYYLGAGYGLLTGTGPVGGARFVFIVGFMLAGLGTYAFVRRRWNAHAGVLAAVVYVYSPYIILVDPHMRGDLAETFALAVFPGVMWAFDRLLDEGRGWHAVRAAALLAALIFTHNLMALLLTALLVGWLLWVTAFTEAAHKRLAWLGAALGVGLAGFFWAPVLLEASAVQLDRLVGPGHFDYRNHFLSVGALLQPSPALDLGAVNPAYALNLGVAAWALALLGGAALVAQARGPKTPPKPRAATLEGWRRMFSAGALDEAPPAPGGALDLAYFALAALVFVLLMLPASDIIWRAIPAMPMIQFPWRLLGPAAFCLAVLAGAATRWIRPLPATARALGLAALVAVPLVLALPTLYPPPWDPDFGATTPQAYIEFELSGVALGTTAGGEFLPATVLTPPGPQTTLIESYTAAGGIDKVNRATLPAGTRVDTLEHGPTHDLFLVRSAQAFPLRLYTFAFPGWRAEIDNQPAEIEIAEPEGFIVVNVPAGAHEVRVFLGATPARSAGVALSALSGAALAAVAFSLARRPRQPAPRPDLLGLRSAAAVLAAGFLLAGLKAVADAQPGLVYHRSAPGEVQVAAQPHSQAFADNIELLAYDLPTRTARPGARLTVTLYWRATGPVERNYQVFVHLTPLGAATPAAQSDKLNPGDYPTTRWSPERYVRDTHAIALPPDLAPGQYIVSAGLYLLETGERLMTADPDPDDKVVLPAFIEIAP